MDAGNDVSVKLMAAEVSVRISGLKPSIDQEEQAEFMKIYWLSSLKILCNRGGHRKACGLR